MVKVSNNLSSGKETNKNAGQTVDQNIAVDSRKISRRGFLKVAGTALGTVAVSAVAKACEKFGLGTSVASTPVVTKEKDKTQVLTATNSSTPPPTSFSPVEQSKNSTNPEGQKAATKTAVAEPTARKDIPIPSDTPTLVPDTETPAPELCPNFDQLREIIKKEGITNYKSILVLSEDGLKEVSGYIEGDLTSENNLKTTRTSYQSELVKTLTNFVNAGANRDSQGNLKENVEVVIPNFISDTSGFKTMVSGNLPNFEFPSNINVTSYKPEVAIPGDAFLLSVHQGKKIDDEPSTFRTAIWKNANVELSGDSYSLNGLLMGFRNTKDNGTVLETIPAQKYPDDSRAQIVIYKGCEPLIAKTDGKDNVLALNRLKLISNDSPEQEFVWVDLEGQKVESEYIRPLVPVAFTENIPEITDLSWSRTPNTEFAQTWEEHLNMVYDTIVASYARFLEEKPQNKAVWDEVINEHPQWQGITNASPEADRLAAMQAFLTKSGGTITADFVSGQEDQEVDFNNAIVFEFLNREPSDPIPEGYVCAFRDQSASAAEWCESLPDDYVGIKIYTNEIGQLVYSKLVYFDIKRQEEALKQGRWKDSGMISSFGLLETLEDQAASDLTSLHMRDYKNSTINKELFVWGPNVDWAQQFGITNALLKGGLKSGGR